jgi:hypothetical protein
VPCPVMSVRVLDRSIQAHRGIGPDEVRIDQIARLELRKRPLGPGMQSLDDNASLVGQACSRR